MANGEQLRLNNSANAVRTEEIRNHRRIGTPAAIGGLAQS
jgi:hypothetical protein